MSVLLISTTDDGIRTLTLNRPESRNALSGELLKALSAAMAEADADDSVAVVVLTGTDPAFSAGLDLRELGTAGNRLAGTGQPSSSGDDAEPQQPWPPIHKPLIGAINGVAVTGGLELALNCDFLVASERARFGDTHTRVGVMPGWGLTVLLPQAIGIRRAREMSLTGNFLTAEEAFHWGLVNHVVPHEELMPLTMKLASDIAGNDRPGVLELLASYGETSRMAGGEGLRHEAKISRAWQRRAFDPEEVARRRDGIISRGRSQG